MTRRKIATKTTIMKAISDVTFLVADCGLFLPMAHCLAEQAKRVIYWSPERRAFPSVRQDCIGDGFEDIERVRDFWPMLGEIDCFVFPDIGQSALQEYLREIGKPVWGSGPGDKLELNRHMFMELQEHFGMDVAPYHVCHGLAELREFLSDKKDKYIKISRFRGDMETHHYRSWRQDESWLDSMAVNFGGVKEQMKFLVFDEIETDLEIGADTWCIDGRWPSLQLSGIESKDKSYLAAVTRAGEMPDPIKRIQREFAELLQAATYRNQICFEVRVKDDKAYFIDFTARAGMPSSGTNQLIWKNFPDIVWHGANGEMLEPEPIAQFSVECMITTKCEKDAWTCFELDPELVGWARLSWCCKVDGAYCFPPDEHHEGELGWLVALGDTPAEAVRAVRKLADLLPDGVNADVEALTGVIEEVDSMEKADIPFTDKPMPTLEEIVEH